MLSEYSVEALVAKARYALGRKTNSRNTTFIRKGEVILNGYYIKKFPQNRWHICQLNDRQMHCRNIQTAVENCSEFYIFDDSKRVKQLLATKVGDRVFIDRNRANLMKFFE